MQLSSKLEKYYKAFLGKTAEGKYQVPGIDEITHILEVISDVHHEIHEGKSFSAHYAITTAATNGHRSGIYIKTPIAPQIHIVFAASASTAADFSINEAPTIAANTGTHTGVIFNRFRDSDNVSTCKNNATTPVAGVMTTLTEAQIAGDGTWTVGTVLWTAPLSVGTGPKAAGGVSRGVQEYILKASTAYVLLVTNTAASANNHGLELDWYEHASKQA